jgi:alkylation response protein AidB-like acyl-CoA dehydrogenase
LVLHQALGIATGAYELALKYSQERKALERNFQTPSYFI